MRGAGDKVRCARVVYGGGNYARCVEAEEEDVSGKVEAGVGESEDGRYIPAVSAHYGEDPGGVKYRAVVRISMLEA